MDAQSFWEGFGYSFNDAHLRGLLFGIEAHRKVAGNSVMATEWTAQPDKLNRVRAVYGTTALKGNPLSEAEVAHTIGLIGQSCDSPLAHLSKEQIQIRNAARARSG